MGTLLVFVTLGEESDGWFPSFARFVLLRSTLSSVLGVRVRSAAVCWANASCVTTEYSGMPVVCLKSARIAVRSQLDDGRTQLWFVSV